MLEVVATPDDHDLVVNSHGRRSSESLRKLREPLPAIHLWIEALDVGQRQILLSTTPGDVEFPTERHCAVVVPRDREIWPELPASGHEIIDLECSINPSAQPRKLDRGPTDDVQAVTNHRSGRRADSQTHRRELRPTTRRRRVSPEPGARSTVRIAAHEVNIAAIGSDRRVVERDGDVGETSVGAAIRIEHVKVGNGREATRALSTRSRSRSAPRRQRHAARPEGQEAELRAR